MSDFDLELDLDKGPRMVQTVRVRVGDRGSCRIRAKVRKNGSDFPLDGYSARFECLKADGTYIRDTACTVSGSTIEHTLCPEAASAPGRARVAYFAIVKGQDVVDSTESFALDVQRNMESGATGASSGYVGEVDEMLAALEEQKRQAAEATSKAEDAARAAEDAAEEVLRRAEAGEFDGEKGDKGDTGPQGPKGEDGDAAAVVNLGAGYFAMSVSEEGHLIVTHNDNEPAPPLSIKDGRLVYTID